MELTEHFLFAKNEADRLIRENHIYGAVFGLVGDSPIVAMGQQCFSPESVPMTADSIFDLASVGKNFTASACAFLAIEGKLDVDAPFTEYLPEHVLAKENCNIRVRDLAMHVGGFNNNKPYQSSDMTVFHRELFAKRPVQPRLQAFEYACSNFIMLGKIVERITGERLDEYCRRKLWEPLGMTHTTWEPVIGNPHAVQFPDTFPIGRHNDPDCNNCPFPIGSGSAFSTAGDMLLFLEDLLKRRTFPQPFYDLLFTCRYENGPDQRRSFGFDMCDNRRPKGFSRQAIFHTGWTGQTVIADPGTGFAGLIFTNRRNDHDRAIHERNTILSCMIGQH